MALFLIVTRRTPAFRAEVLPDHRRFLSELARQGRLELSGPFADGTGGAYLIRATSLEEAKTVAEQDPLASSGASELVVKEWQATLGVPDAHKR